MPPNKCNFKWQTTESREGSPTPDASGFIIGCASPAIQPVAIQPTPCRVLQVNLHHKDKSTAEVLQKIAGGSLSSRPSNKHEIYCFIPIPAFSKKRKTKTKTSVVPSHGYLVMWKKPWICFKNSEENQVPYFSIYIIQRNGKHEKTCCVSKEQHQPPPHFSIHPPVLEHS